MTATQSRAQDELKEIINTVEKSEKEIQLGLCRLLRRHGEEPAENAEPALLLQMADTLFERLSNIVKKPSQIPEENPELQGLLQEKAELQGRFAGLEEDIMYCFRHTSRCGRKVEQERQQAEAKFKSEIVRLAQENQRLAVEVAKLKSGPAAEQSRRPKSRAGSVGRDAPRHSENVARHSGSACAVAVAAVQTEEEDRASTESLKKLQTQLNEIRRSLNLLREFVTSQTKSASDSMQERVAEIEHLASRSCQAHADTVERLTAAATQAGEKVRLFQTRLVAQRETVHATFTKVLQDLPEKFHPGAAVEGIAARVAGLEKLVRERLLSAILRLRQGCSNAKGEVASEIVVTKEENEKLRQKLDSAEKVVEAQMKETRRKIEEEKAAARERAKALKECIKKTACVAIMKEVKEHVAQTLGSFTGMLKSAVSNISSRIEDNKKSMA